MLKRDERAGCCSTSLRVGGGRSRMVSTRDLVISAGVHIVRAKMGEMIDWAVRFDR